MELIDRDAAQALISGRHGAPFDVLGRHPSGGGWVVRAFVPEAEALFLLEGDAAPQPFEPLGQGLFAIAAPRIAADYRLRARHNGADWEFDDPYRFGPVLGEIDEYLISEGTHRRLWQRLGAHPTAHEGVEGTVFAVWAPNARRVAVVGDFNHWNPSAHPMRLRGATGVWEIFMPAVGAGALYKYDLLAPDGSGLPKKADPFGFGAEHPPATGSIVRRLPDPPPPERRRARAVSQSVDAPISIYEVHLGSWRRKVDRGGRRLSYPELAEELVAYVRDMGFTHIELMPISEFPFDGSWGYQPVGLFAPTVRHGTAEEFRDFVAAAHAGGLGVILDWVPGHFPTDPHGLGWFDGTPLYQYADPREGFHRDWNTLIFDYGRREVRNYLTSNALYWLSQYGLDGLRVDAVASMLYRDYSRPEGEWVPNIHGGRENLEAIDFLREVNSVVYAECPGAMTVAEESTSFPGVSRPVHDGGLGFGFKWDMGWMNDTLDYIRREPIHRSYHHGQLTFGLAYAFSENFILPISHDEVVHGKGSMLGKMPGSFEEKFANLRGYYGFMWGHPGKKLLFMGCEFAQAREWNHDQSLDWHLLENPLHAGVSRLVQDLNRTYRENRALHLHDTRPEGFEWLVADDAAQSLLAFLRKGGEGDPPVMVVCNFTPVERPGYRIGLPREGRWDEILNTDAGVYGGGNRGNFGHVDAEPLPWDGQPCSAVVTLPPLATLFFRAPR